MKNLSDETKRKMNGRMGRVSTVVCILLICLSSTLITGCGKSSSNNGKSKSSYSYSSSSSSYSNSSYSSSNKSNSTSSYSSSKSSKSCSDVDVIVAAKFQVKQRLKAPSTAKFCKQNELSIRRLSDSIVVTGYVDAENSFGATVRSYFTVTLTEDGSSLKDIYIN